MDKKAAAVWGDPDTYATCLLALGLDRYGRKLDDPTESPIHWTEATWVQEVMDDTGVELPRRNLDRIQAACLLMTRPHEFYGDPRGFGDVVLSLSAAYFEPGVWHPPTVEETLWGVIESYLLDPPEDDSVRFDPSVVGYVNYIAMNEGFRTMPDAFGLFGVPTDPEVWRHAGGIDYSEDPSTNLVVVEAAAARDRDLAVDTAERLRDLAARLKVLPVEHIDISVPNELYAFADRIAAEANAHDD